MSNSFKQDAGKPTGSLRLVASLAAIAASMSAHATLGGDAASVTRDQAALRATVTTEVKAAYTDYRLAMADGAVVHEFVTASGKVFEVTWASRGHRPDMEQLLGGYVSRFARAKDAHRPTDRHADRVEPDLEIHSMVHNRYFSGTAHLPGMLPETMTTRLGVPVESK